MRVVGAAHVEVAGLVDDRPGSSYENDDTRTWRRKYSLGSMRSGYTGRPLSRVVKRVPPSSIIRNIGTQIADSSTTPMRSSGMRSSVPLRMRSVHASAAAVQRKIDSSGGSPPSSGTEYQTSSNTRR